MMFLRNKIIWWYSSKVYDHLAMPNPLSLFSSVIGRIQVECLNLFWNFQKYKLLILKDTYSQTSKSFLAKQNLLLQIEGIEATTPPRKWLLYHWDFSVILLFPISTYNRSTIVRDTWRWSRYQTCGQPMDLKYSQQLLVLYAIFVSPSHKMKKVQEQPYYKMWTIWQNFLKNHICNNRWKSNVELGNWKVKANDSDQLFPFNYLQWNNTLYKSYCKKWFSHMEYKYGAICGNNPDFYTFVVSQKVFKIPSDAVPCDVEDSDKWWHILDHQSLDVRSQPE